MNSEELQGIVKGKVIYIYIYIYEILEKEKFIFARFKKEIFVLQHFLLKKLKIAHIIIVEY